jgi:two-component system alkaline phosphatase synthesis response regulator PhoP
MPTILIVEDQRDLAAGLKDNCEYEGYEALNAFDGDEGLRVALERRPDLILLDICSPSGTASTSAARSAPPGSGRRC